MTTIRRETIGRATLYCGDSLELLRAGAFGQIGAIVSDPPYGIGYQHGGGGGGIRMADGKLLATRTDTIIGDDVHFDPAPWIEAAPASQGSVVGAKNGLSPLILLWGADHFRTRLPAGGTLLAWDKHVGVGCDDSFTDCEWAWCGRKVRREVFRHLWKGILARKAGEDIDGMWRRRHVSQKPVELMRWCIDKARPVPGLPVLDPYMGSGSTGIAALSLGLPFIGCEIDETHFEAACERIRLFAEQGPTVQPSLLDVA